ncbi:MAG: iron-sulfur cluster-binding protein [Actinobacteria bacterium]|nr:iron-sulfur cluster-binding protein [Actinomycetota bacterium]
MSFPTAAKSALANPQLRHNLARATRTIRARRAAVVSEVADWERQREAGAAIKDAALLDLDRQLERLEAAVQAAGGSVHWAPDAAAATAIIARLVRAAGSTEAIKVKSMASEEIGLDEALAAAGITAHETDLAELIVQLGDDRPSHILVPAIHRNRVEIRDLFEAKLGERGLSPEPRELAAAARRHLRERFLSVGVGISGANFAVAETGAVCLVESEGNGRMCTTLPHTLITLMGIEKVVPRFADLATMLPLLARSATGERMNPYTSLWTGAREDGDGPRDFHLVLLDNGRTDVLADAVGRQSLRCIRCSACLNVCPVYERTGGHAYESTYPGPIGAILSPQLSGMREHASLPAASTLCGACYEVCPVKIDIPAVLVHLRARVVAGGQAPRGEGAAMRALARILLSRRGYEAAQRAARHGELGPGQRLLGPLAAWTVSRELPQAPAQSFRGWWHEHRA